MMTTDERCKHELVIGQCADCRPQAPGSGNSTVKPEKIIGVPTMRARYDSTCKGCGIVMIHQGEYISLIDDKWVCGQCHLNYADNL
jgi:ribosomal protein S27AE